MKTIAFSLIFAFMIMLTACKKEGDITTDAIAPIMQLTINGGGFSKTFRSTEDYTNSQLNFKPNTHYTFNLTINDAGGVQRLQLQLDKTLLIGTVTSAPAATITETTLQKIYSIFGIASTPYTSFLLSGSFTTPNATQGEDLGLSILCGGRDYTPNLASINISCLLSQTPPNGYGWVTF